MRSRSTLLSHLLGSHPDICGYKEYLRRYHSKKDFMRLRLQTFKEFQWKRPRFLQDKVLHAQYTPPLEVLQAFPTKSILFIREPIESLKSIIAMEKRNGNQIDNNASFACGYYCSRIEDIITIAQGLPKDDYLFFDSSEIVENTVSTLKNIEDFLGLQTPLNSSYKLFKDTGKRLKGDSSENIQAGKILDLKSDRYADIQLDEATTTKAKAAYQKALTAIKV